MLQRRENNDVTGIRKNRSAQYAKKQHRRKLRKGIVSVSLIILGVALTAAGVYDKIARFAGAGTLVPITGFANAMSSAAIEFQSEGFVTGVGAKLFSIAGPVLVYGITASVLYGAVLWGLHLMGITLF